MGNSYTSLNLIQKIEKDGIDISRIDVQLVWIDGIKKTYKNTKKYNL